MFPDAPPVVLPEIEILTPPEEAVELEPPVKVVIHNDDVTPFDFVSLVLRVIFQLTPADAESITYTAHTTGAAVVGVLPLEEAKYRVGQAHSLARQNGYPLTFSIEPE